MASLAPPSMALADAPSAPVDTWFFLCGPLSLNVFLFGLAWNLRVFQRHELAFDKVMDMRRDEVPTARGVALFATLLTLIQTGLFGLEVWRRGDAFGVDEVQMELLLVFYCVAFAVLLLCPFDILHRRARFFVARRVGRCLWPFQNFSLDLPPHPTPFIEVFLADGLTSLSKFIQDSAVAWMLLSLSFTQELGQLRSSYVSKMKSSPLPYFAASMPYIIRATQCLISFQRTSSANDRFLHLLNTLKYCSSLLVISVGAYPQVMEYTNVRLDKNSFFLFCAVFNSLYSFLWDVIMDWGLGQPHLPKRVRFLRHQLLYKPHVLYYVVIGIDFLLRILWVTKWWDWDHIGVDFKMLSMLAEVVRRCIWNVLRVEWQCIKLEILGSKKLSEDSMELEQNMEKMPLMTEDEDEESSSDDGDKDSGEDVDDDKPDTLPHSIQESRKERGYSNADGVNITVVSSAAASSSPTKPHRVSRAPSRAADEEAEGTIIAPAAITVATYSRSSQTHVVSAGSTTPQHRKPHPSADEDDEAFLAAAMEAA